MTRFTKLPATTTALLVVALALVSFWLGGYLKDLQYGAYFDSIKTKRITYDPYTLVAPLVGTESPSALQIGRLQTIYTSLKEYGDKHKDDVDTYSLYFRDLNSSQWVGINEDEAYIPASLLKIALAMALLKQEESDPSFKTMSKVYTQKIANINTSINYLQPSKLQIGKSYGTEDLLSKMIVDSDNGAKDLIFSLLNKQDFYNLFRLIGVRQPDNVLKYTLSTKDYAFFIRLLYNASYISPENSQKLLEIMAHTKFADGLVAGVPSHVTVAHKYGSFTLSDDNGQPNGIELHDCGIIYESKHPYILCIMTKGQDAVKQASFIAGMSSTAYSAVEEYFEQN